MYSSTVTILLVEDDDVDADAIKRAFLKARIANPIIVAKDGIEALAILQGTHETRHIDEPFMILLDLNLPRMNGIEFLEAIRADEKLDKSIVFVLTTSDDDRDILSAYDNHVAGYVVKSRAGEDFLDVTSLLKHYWRIIEFPPNL